jgi:hypothetical protein
MKSTRRPGSHVTISSDGRRCFKRYIGPFSEERAFDERTALETCRRNGLRAPRAIASGHGDQPWLVMTRCPGESWRGAVASDPEQYIRAVGAYLERLHQLFVPSQPGFGWLPSCQDVFEDSAAFLAFLMRTSLRRLADDIRARLLRVLQRSCRAAPLVPLHRDIKPEHVLHAGAVATLGFDELELPAICILDWEYASRGPALCDWGTLIWRAWTDCASPVTAGARAMLVRRLADAVLVASKLPEHDVAVGLARAALVWAEHREQYEFDVAVACCLAILENGTIADALMASALPTHPQQRAAAE